MEQEPNRDKPTNDQQQAKKNLEQIVNQLADQGTKKVEQIFGPIRETNIPQSELDQLFSEAKSLTHTELAQRCYELSQKYPASKIPKSFQNYLNQLDRKEE